MFRLIAQEPAAAGVLAAARGVCGDALLDSLLRGDDEPPDAVDLFANAVAQPLICAATLGCWLALQDHGLPEPGVIAGYSVGELSAHALAGTFLRGVEVLPVAHARALAMDRAAGPAAGSLLGVRGLGEERVREIAGACGLEIAIVNGATHFVLGGSEAGLAEGERRLLEATPGGSGSGVTVRRLDVGVAAHTSGLTTAAGPLRDALEAAALQPPRIPVLAGIHGGPVRTAGDARDTLVAQLNQTIRWDRCLRAAWELGARVFLTLGPGCGLARIALEELPAGCEVRTADDFRTLAGAAAWVRSRVGDS